MAAGAGQVRMFSDDGICVDDPLIMRRALEYATGLGVLIAQHAEEPRLTVGAVAHEGPNAARLGLAGWPRAAEESIVARDALLARDAGARVHICHASTAGTVEIVRWAKEQGISITAEVTPHHLLLDDTRLATYDGRNRVNPPLREASDAEALRQALADGVIDCVATDHAPHAEHEKFCEFAAARPGMLGLQTALSVVVETMVRPGLLTWRDVARVMSENPARIVGLPDQGRPLEVGEPANLTVVDPDATWTVSGSALASRSDNTPYESMTLPATVTLTLLRGKVTARDGKSPGASEHARTPDARRVADHGRGAGRADRVRHPGDDAGLAQRARAAGRADRQAAAAAGHRRARAHPGDQGPLRRQHARAELAGPHRGRRPRLPQQGRAHPLSRGNHVAAHRRWPDLDPRRSITAIRTERGHRGQGAHARRHPGDPLAAAVGHRDRHRVPRRRPRRIRAMGGGGPA